jgi:hypothetical protein
MQMILVRSLVLPLVSVLPLPLPCNLPAQQPVPGINMLSWQA